MADEIQVVADTGLDLYCMLRNPAGEVWDPGGEAFETYGTGGRAANDYRVVLTDKEVGFYVGDFDENITTEGVYVIVVYEQAGVDPADTDMVLGSDVLGWNGKSEIDPLVISRSAYLRANKSVQDKLTGVITTYDTDGSTPLYVETETDNGDGTITVEVSAAT